MSIEVKAIECFDFKIEETTKIELAAWLDKRELNGISNYQYLCFLKTLCKDKEPAYQDGLIKCIIAANRQRISLTSSKKSDNYNVSTSERTTDYPRPFEYNKKDPDNGRD